MKTNAIDAIILCGGLGTRLRSVIGESPKPMAEFGHEPFLNVILKDLRDQGFQRVILCAGYKGETIAQYYRQHDLGLDIIVSIEPRPLGTGGAIQYAKGWIGSEPFLVLNGDSLCRMDYGKFLDFHVSQKALASIAVVKVRETKDFGTIVLDRTQKIVGFAEKTSLKAKVGRNLTTGINAGVYAFSQEIFSIFSRKKKFSLEYNVFPNLLTKKFFGFEIKAGFIDIGTPERFKQAEKFLRKR